MRAEDAAEHAAALGDAPDRLVREAVLELAELAGHVGGDDGYGNPPAGIAALEQREGVLHRPLAHMGDVDEDAVVHHRPTAARPSGVRPSLGCGKTTW